MKEFDVPSAGKEHLVEALLNRRQEREAQIDRLFRLLPASGNEKAWESIGRALRRLCEWEGK